MKNILYNNKMFNSEVENSETGKKSKYNMYLFMPQYEMTAIIKVSNIDIYKLPDNKIQISVDCEALDACGWVFEMSITYFPETKDEYLKIIRKINKDFFYLAKGSYNILLKERHITMHEAEIKPLPECYNKNDVIKAFEINREK